jgi:hypothetical protein
LSTDVETLKAESVSEDVDLGRAVRVRWIDSGLAAHDGWMLRSDIPDNVATVETVGLWLGENDNVVMVAGTRATAESMGSEQYLNAQVIYKPCIVSKEWLS